jgi:hypothetical protein
MTENTSVLNNDDTLDSFERRMLHIRYMAELRPILARVCNFSTAQRNDLLEYLTILSTIANNDNQRVLDELVQYAQDYFIFPYFSITDEQHASSVRSWLDLNLWDNLSNETIILLLRQYRPVFNNDIISRMNELQSQVTEIYNFIIR